MQRKQRNRLSGASTAAAAAAALALVGAGCTTDAGESMIIIQNQIPESGCEIPSDETANFRGAGTIDVRAAEGYVFTPLVESLVIARAGSPRVVAVRGADIDVRFPEGFFSADEESDLRDARLTRFSQAFSGSISPGGRTSFGFVTVPRSLLARLGDELGDGEEVLLETEVVVFGDLDGGDVESVPYIYPVTVCDGCMTIDNGDCASIGEGFEPSQGGECNQLQDVPLDCCTQDDQLVCPVPT
jgi:hypothetical protein